MSSRALVAAATTSRAFWLSRAISINCSRYLTLSTRRTSSAIPSPSISGIRRVHRYSKGGEMPVRFSSFDVSDQAFLEEETCVGIVNLKPLVPCHVLIIPRKPYERFADIPPSEVAALFQAVQRVGKKVEELCGAQALTISLQDGPAAGQSVPHVHVHILPRKQGDFVPNDKIYSHLDSFGLTLAAQQTAFQSDHGPDISDEERKPRSREQMRSEALWLRSALEE